MIQLNILLLLVAFYKFLRRKKVKNTHLCGHMLLIMSYLVTIATECSQNFTKMCLKDKRTATEDAMS